MRMWAAVLIALVAGPGIAQAAGVKSDALRAALARDRGPQPVWVYLKDKAGAAADAPLTPRALSRRQLRGRGPLVGTADLPVSPAYVDAVARVAHVRHVSRWFNAVSVDATGAQIDALAALPFVERLDVVARVRRRPEPAGRPLERPAAAAQRQGARPAIDYGFSEGQVAQLGVPELHALGLSGEGVVVALLDAGFDNLAHEAFASMKIVARHDFVNGDEDVANGTDRGEGSHGTSTLSVLGGYSDGVLIGPAYGATFLLAKTEDTTRETPVEEDNWAAAAEWAEAAGVDVISSSLGYTEFDPGFGANTPAEMDGNTAISTRAADLAAERGVVVVNSAGNDGYDPRQNTLGAPSDGREVLAVAAVDDEGDRAYFSSVGPSADGRTKPDVAAQGVSVLAASSGTPRSYAYVNGTSFSCPLTAGVAALLLQAHPEATPAQVRDALRASGSQATAPDNLLGWGILNGPRALRALEAGADESRRR